MEQKILFWQPVIWPYATTMMMNLVGGVVFDLVLPQQTQLSSFVCTHTVYTYILYSHLCSKSLYRG